MNEKVFCKTLGKKFSTGASYTKGEGIIMQGDFEVPMRDLILESFPNVACSNPDHESQHRD